MATEKRLIDANKISYHKSGFPKGEGFDNRLDWAFREDIDKLPTVDDVEVADMREFAKDVAYQFGYYCQNGGRLHITHGGLSTLEWAFDILGWENPHPAPECECEFDGCHEHATCGTPTKDGYKRVCGKHFCELQKEA